MLRRILRAVFRLRQGRFDCAVNLPRIVQIGSEKQVRRQPLRDRDRANRLGRISQPKLLHCPGRRRDFGDRGGERFGEAVFMSDIGVSVILTGWKGGQGNFKFRIASLRWMQMSERAQLAEAQARIRTTLFGLRQEVNEAFFSAALLQERAGTLAATLEDLEGRLGEMNVRVREGASLAADAAAIEATLLERRQDEAELRATRRGALARLSRLTGRAIADTDVLGLPELNAAVTQARAAVDATRARPEYDQFARTRDRLARQQEVATAQDQPRISAFARVGYGRPGLNFISDQFESYGVAGLQVQWKAWNWGTTNREREALALQQQIVADDEAAFTRGLGRSTEADLAAIDRLTVALGLDDRIIALREEILRSIQARFQERVVTAAEYLDRSAELLQARSARAAHRVELAQASARFLTTLGLEVR